MYMMFFDCSIPSYCVGYQSRPFELSTTGLTALREALVQQPKIVATLSFIRSFLAFSEKICGSEAPSSSTISIFFPSTPPWSLISWMASFSASRTDVSLMAIVPLRECSKPTFTVSPDALLVLPLMALSPPQPVTSRLEARREIPSSFFHILIVTLRFLLESSIIPTAAFSRENLHPGKTKRSSQSVPMH